MREPCAITTLNNVLLYEPDAEILTPYTAIYNQLKAMEEAGRTCYKSENLITEDSHKRFLKMLIDRHHESVLEHSCVSVKIRTNLGVARELERHRHSNIINDHLLALSCESTRYVNQGKEKFGKRVALCPGSDVSPDMLASVNEIAGKYLELSEQGVKPDVLRALLPLCAKADMVFSGSIREWRAVLKLRLSKAAHVDVREVMSILLNKFMTLCPELFEDIKSEVNNG